MKNRFSPYLMLVAVAVIPLIGVENRMHRSAMVLRSPVLNKLPANGNNNSTCWTRETVDAFPKVGKHTSLALDSYGRPHISYYDESNGNLIYAQWQDTGWQIEVVDSPGNVGQYSSLKLDSREYPVIGYFDSAPPNNLKIAFFDNPTTYELNVNVVGSGSVTVVSDPAGIDCGAVCNADFGEGELVTLTATAESGSTFAGWSGACSELTTCQVTMDATSSVTANFSIEETQTFVFLPFVVR